jgi:hypothetical protein
MNQRARSVRRGLSRVHVKQAAGAAGERVPNVKVEGRG